MTWKVGTKFYFLMYDYLSFPSSRFLHLICERIMWWLSGSPCLENVWCGSPAALLLCCPHALGVIFQAAIRSFPWKACVCLYPEKAVFFVLWKQSAAPHTSPWELPLLLHRWVSPSCMQTEQYTLGRLENSEGKTSIRVTGWAALSRVSSSSCTGVVAER